MRYQFLIGDKVKIRKGLRIGFEYFMMHSPVYDKFSILMSKHSGKEATIISIVDGKYQLDVDPIHYYTDGMLEKSNEYNGILEVEQLIEHMIKQLPKQREDAVRREIDKAIDAGDRERFIELTNELKILSVDNRV